MNYVHLARSSFNDEEMFEMLSQSPPFGDLKLRKHFRKTRGVFLSKHIDEEGLARFYSKLGFSWNQFKDLSVYLDSDEAGEKKASLKISETVDKEIIINAIEELQAARKTEESYRVTNKSESISLNANYIKKNFSKSKSLQRENRSFGMEITTKDGYIEIEYDLEDRCVRIANELYKKIQSKAKRDLQQIEIVFLGANRGELQTDFFLKLLSGIDGLSRLSVCDVRVNLTTSKNSDAEDTEDDNTEKLKGLVQSAALKGEDVTSSKMFQQLLKDGYYISGITWYVKEVGGDKRKLVLEAGFREIGGQYKFYADGKKIYGTDADGLESDAKRMLPFQKLAFQRKILSAAYRIHHEINKK